MLQANNSLAVINARREDPARALPYLRRAESLYEEFLGPGRQPLLSPPQAEATAEKLQAMQDCAPKDAWWILVRLDSLRTLMCLALGSKPGTWGH